MAQSLFETDDPAPQAARLAAALRSLAERGISIGTSSWKYEGWLGSIYNRDRYLTRGRFSKKKFEAECLREYAETFPAVGGDFSFYQFPSKDFWDKLFASTPPTFVFGLKAPEEITVLRWPGHARYGARSGMVNEHFLDAELFEGAFLRPLEPHRRQVGVIMFEFGTFASIDLPQTEFLARLQDFIAALPIGWNFGVEIRNREYLDTPYFEALSRHRVAHVFNAWTRMPPLAEQIELPGAWSADFAVVRALLQPGRSYEAAVQAFEPYERTQSPDESLRESLRTVIRRSLEKQQRAYIFVNNRAEGNAPSTIEAVVK
ncbi:MAG TPA: DUF72 domain-containing protein [Urbifossiella sp.]|nr:DUF72 domain-containing protein [Urbifossiella sp.]